MHDLRVDISEDSCPITFVRTKLALEKLSSGQVLEVIGQGEEPRHNVPSAVRDHGHVVLEINDLENGKFRLLIQAKF